MICLLSISANKNVCMTPIKILVLKRNISGMFSWRYKIINKFGFFYSFRSIHDNIIIFCPSVILIDYFGTLLYLFIFIWNMLNIFYGTTVQEITHTFIIVNLVVYWQLSTYIKEFWEREREGKRDEAVSLIPILPIHFLYVPYKINTYCNNMQN